MSPIHWTCNGLSAGEVPELSIHYQPDGRAHLEGGHSVLRLRGGETEGALPQHTLLQAADQPEHHLL